jgi:hypothetical protein
MDAIKLGIQTPPNIQTHNPSDCKGHPMMVQTWAQLNKASHLKVRLGGHVTLPHFKDVSILIEGT